MKNFLSKITSYAAAVVVLIVGCAMAGLGLTVLAVLAMFVLGVFGLALIASPFVKMSHPDIDTLKQKMSNTNPAAA